MNRNRLFNILGCGLLVLLAACQAANEPLNAAMAQPVEEIQGMRLATGAADATPLWAYCSPSQENTPIRTFHCSARVWQTLAIGHLFLLTDQALLNRGGAELVWELAIDDHVIDLDSFGTFDYVMPAMPASPSPIREVFAKVTDWNLVMTNLNPGEHVLHFRAQDGLDQYNWLVNLVIDGTTESDISSVPFAPKS